MTTETKEFLRGSSIILVMMIICVVSITLLEPKVQKQKEETNKAIEKIMDDSERTLYSGWQKMNPDKNISFEEFKYLRHSRLLPEQQNQNREVDTHPIKTGIVAGVSAVVAKELLK